MLIKDLLTTKRLRETLEELTEIRTRYNANDFFPVRGYIVKPQLRRYWRKHRTNGNGRKA